MWALNWQQSREKLIPSSIHYILRQCTIKVMGDVANLLVALVYKVHTTRTANPKIAVSSEGVKNQARAQDVRNNFKNRSWHLCSFWNAMYSGRVLGIKISALLCGGWPYWKFNFISNNITPRVVRNGRLGSRVPGAGTDSHDPGATSWNSRAFVFSKMKC